LSFVHIGVEVESRQTVAVDFLSPLAYNL